MADAILQSALVVVGPGRAGTAFGRSWKTAGGTLLGVIGRTSVGAARGAAALGTEGRTLEDAWPSCGILILSVPDDRIAEVAAEVGGRIRAPLAFHLSGALPSAALAPLARNGAAIGSIHPLRAFTGDPADDWSGAIVALEGDDAAVEAGERIAAAVGASAFRIAAAAKPLYHASASLAAGGTMALLSVAVRAAVAAGVPEDEARAALARLAAQAAAATATRPFDEAFTGPIARRDVETVRAHRRAADSREDFLELYRRLASEILRVTDGRGREEEIHGILADRDARNPR